MREPGGVDGIGIGNDTAPGAVTYVCEWNDSGIGVAARRCVAALQCTGLQMSWGPLRNDPGGRVLGEPTAAEWSAHDVPPVLAGLPRRAGHCEAAILHSVVTSWPSIVGTLRPERSIGHCVWETETIPRRWHGEMGCVDELWVPTEWNRDAMLAAGLGKAVHVVPHSASTTVAGECPLDLPDDHTIFVLVAAWDWRKRPDLAVAAFLDAFGADDPVTLVVKTGPRVQAWPAAGIERHTWWQLMDVVRRHDNPAAVVLETGRWSDEQMAALMQRANCFISLTHSEGWGLGAFEAACAGTPVIITGYGGQVEWLGDDYPGLLPFSMVAADHPDRSLFEPGMTWACADRDAAVETMRAIAAGRAGRLVEAAASLKPMLLDRYAPAAVGRIARQALDG